MPIRAFLDSEAFFDPETIQNMSYALSAACQTLELKDNDDVATRLLAMRIIDLATDGVHDRGLLKAAALRGFPKHSRVVRS